MKDRIKRFFRLMKNTMMGTIYLKHFIRMMNSFLFQYKVSEMVVSFILKLITDDIIAQIIKK